MQVDYAEELGHLQARARVNSGSDSEMIAVYRSDITLEESCEALAAVEAEPTLWEYAGRPCFRLPRARDGITWALRRLGVGPKDEVVFTTLTSETVPRAVIAAGATPVAVGLSAGSLSPSVAHYEAAVGPSTKALIVPHLYGKAEDLSPFRALADRRGLLFIEDCAHCLDGLNAHRGVGGFGDVVILSFDWAKPITIGWGGLVTISEDRLDGIGQPEHPVMTERLDRLLAAAFLLDRWLTDSSHLPHQSVSAAFALHYLIGSHDDPDRWVEEILKLAVATDGPDRLEAWFADRVKVPPRKRAARLPYGLKSIARDRLPRSLMVRAGYVIPGSRQARLEGTTLLPGGLCDRLTAAQYRRFRSSVDGTARQAIAAVYQRALDPDEFFFPEANKARHWLVYPVFSRRTLRRSGLEERVAARMGVNIAPHLWPCAAHRAYGLKGRVITGPGSRETARTARGLLNLPVHSQTSPETALSLAELLNGRSLQPTL